MPWNRKDYPANWGQLRAAVRARAGDCCEGCGVPNGAFIVRDRQNPARYERLPDTWTATDEQWTVEDGHDVSVVEDGQKVTMVVCTTAHRHGTEKLSQNLGDLLFLCQRCHLCYDAAAHQEKRAATLARRRLHPLQLRLGDGEWI